MRLASLLTRKGGAIVPGVTRARPILTDTALPDAVDVVVVGGGNIGCATALTLAERGVKVALCEKGAIAGEASGRSLGYIDSLFLDPVKVGIIERSKVLWEEMNARVGAETGYRRTGIAVLFGDEAGVAAAQGWLDSVKGGVDGRILSRKEAADLAVGSPDPFAGALHVPSDGVAEAQLAAPAMAEQVRRRGGVVLQNCAVRGIEMSGGKTAAAVTEQGKIRCSSVIVTSGVWSPIFLRNLGLDLPQFMAFASAMRFAPGAAGPSAGLVSTLRNLVMRRTFDGGYDACTPVGVVPVTPATIGNFARLRPAMKSMAGQLLPVFNLETFLSQWSLPSRWGLDEVSPFERNRVLMPELDRQLLDGTLRDMQAAYPAIAAAGVADRWAGAMTSTLDNMPVISAVDSHPGLFIGSGFYYGLTMAPAAGEALADLVMGMQPRFDLSQYRFSRFSDGSPTVFRS